MSARRRVWTRLVALVTASGLALAGALTGAWVALGQPAAQGSVWFEVTGTSPVESHYWGTPGEPFFFLALGNDGRQDTDPGLGDAIHVIGVNPALHQATILDIPRDTLAPDGDKLTSWHANHGLPGIVTELDKLLGVQIHYAITTNFPEFTAMVDEMGGIDVVIPEQLHDEDSGAFFAPGPQHLSGDDTLRFARDRKDFARGDIVRTFNQGTIILGALATLRAQHPGPAGTAALVAILGRHVRTQNVGIADLFRLGRLALSLDPSAVKNVTLPVANPGDGTTNLLPVGADDLLADFRDDGVLQNH